MSSSRASSVPHPQADTSSDDGDDWEEVAVPEDSDQTPQLRYGAEPLEITLPTRRVANAKGAKSTSSRKGVSHAQRLLRIACHKAHTVCLLGNAWVRNKWINDTLLHARLMSLTPLHLQNAFLIIHKQRVPDQTKRGRLFEAAVVRLVEWWSQEFFDVLPTGHIRNRTFEEVQQELEAQGDYRHNGGKDSLDDGWAEDDVEDLRNEVIRSPKSLMKHALMRCGSRDVSAQLFTSLCRALDVPARLVVSLQSVSWKAGVGRSKADGKKSEQKAKAGPGDMSESELSSEDIQVEDKVLDVKGKGKAKEFPGEGNRLDGGSSSAVRREGKDNTYVRLRRSKSKGQKLGSSPSSSTKESLLEDPTTTPPVFWTEVFSRPDSRWIPVDPIRCIVNKRKAFDPSSFAPSTGQQRALSENRMVYVLAFEEDGYARDVTRRYAREYGAKVAKVQLGGAAGKGGRAKEVWWQGVLGAITRPYRLQRDDLEDEEFATNQLTEAMPTSIAGFKDHPLYVLPRHLLVHEVIHPLDPVGTFRGESVYLRSCVIPLKSAENWMRSGRVVRQGEQPMKLGKVRASTINRQRALEVAGGNGGEESENGVVTQGMYAESQTELYTPPPVQDGKVPKNDFGNIDLYVPSMLPAGAVHIPFKGVAKIARRLEFDYAEAVTGFEFKKRRAFPIIEGVVIAAENESALLEAFWEAEQDASEKARAKIQERVIQQWFKLIQGLRIRQRLKEQYKRPDSPIQEVMDSFVVQGTSELDAERVEHGRFLIGAEDAIQPFKLPRNKYHTTTFQNDPTASSSQSHFKEDDEFKYSEIQIGDEVHDVNNNMEAFVSNPADSSNAIPMSMRELAEASALQEEEKQEPPFASASESTTKVLPSARQRRANPERVRKKRARGSPKASSDSSDHEHSSPPKRERSQTTRAHTEVSVAKRNLRPRLAKSPAKLQEEKEMEQAYRRAIEK